MSAFSSAQESQEPNGKRRLIVLGCGYLGRAVAEQALQAGWNVEALTRNAEKAARLEEELGIRVVLGDLADSDWHHSLDPLGAWVVNCVSSGGGGEAGYRRAYYLGSVSVRIWLEKKGGGKGLLYTGSTSVYPQTDGVWVDDHARTEATTDLNEILLKAEDVCASLILDRIVPRAAVVRLAGIYGPGRHYLIDQLRTGKTTFAGPGDYHLNLIHRDDAASALLALASREDWTGWLALNCADGNPATKEAVAAWTAEKLGLGSPEFRPDELSDRMRRRLLSDGRPPDRRIRGESLRREFGWTPRYPDFRAGYTEILAALPG
jgi:nucleoside-diphosphate-sugar epimerase